VLTGDSRPEEVQRLPPPQRPTHVVPSIADLYPAGDAAPKGPDVYLPRRSRSQPLEQATEALPPAGYSDTLQSGRAEDATSTIFPAPDPPGPPTVPGRTI